MVTNTAMPDLTSKRGLGPGRARTAAETCRHANPVHLQLFEYTRYGTWVGCIECGTSWLIRGG